MKRKFALLFVLFAIILALAGLMIVVQRNEISVRNTKVTTSTSNGTHIIPEPLVIQQEYAYAANTFKGSIIASHPCQALQTGVDFQDESLQQIRLIFATADDTAESCKQGAVKKDFIIVVPSGEEAKLSAVELNGQPVAFEVKSQ